jgi:hypothetical protein
MSGDTQHQRAHIELAIERARDRVGDTIDELDHRVRDRLDVKRIAKDHAWQIAAAGGVLGLVLGLGVPRVLLRLIQIGVPVAIALEIVRRRARSEESGSS